MGKDMKLRRMFDLYETPVNRKQTDGVYGPLGVVLPHSIGWQPVEDTISLRRKDDITEVYKTIESYISLVTNNTTVQTVRKGRFFFIGGYNWSQDKIRNQNL